MTPWFTHPVRGVCCSPANRTRGGVLLEQTDRSPCYSAQVNLNQLNSQDSLTFSAAIRRANSTIEPAILVLCRPQPPSRHATDKREELCARPLAVPHTHVDVSATLIGCPHRPAAAALIALQPPGLPDSVIPFQHLSQTTNAETSTANPRGGSESSQAVVHGRHLLT